VILVDTSVLLDVLTADPGWLNWLERQLEAARLRGRVAVNEIIYAELSVRAALFMAGKVFAQYRARGGARSGVLPDFFIGALAAVERLPLVTRDARRIRFYFPTVEVIARHKRNDRK
jgi:predicted nucleic acid-binding protein